MDLQMWDSVAYLSSMTSAALRIYTTNAADTATFWQGAAESATFHGSVAGVSFASASVTRLKERREALTTKECASVVDAVEPKRYSRSDTKTCRLGFIAQELQEVRRGDIARIVGETPANDELSDHWLTMDYSRLVTILWKCVNYLRSRVTELEQETYKSKHATVWF
jgi:hypothetical protein